MEPKQGDQRDKINPFTKQELSKWLSHFENLLNEYGPDFFTPDIIDFVNSCKEQHPDLLNSPASTAIYDENRIIIFPGSKGQGRRQDGGPVRGHNMKCNEENKVNKLPPKKN